MARKSGAILEICKIGYDLRKDGGAVVWVVAIWNPGPAYETRPVKPTGGDRTPLVIATGTTSNGPWSKAMIIDGDDDRDAGFCYTAIHYTKDAVLLAYCAGGAADKHRLTRLRIRKIPLDGLK